MAGALQTVEHIDCEINCPVCGEEFDDCALNPMILLCGHTVCQRCITKIKDKTHFRYDYFSCPTCRMHIGNSNLKKNYKLEEAVTIVKKLRKRPVAVIPSNPVKCRTCAKVDGEADMFVCIPCINEEVHNSHETNKKQSEIKFALCGSCAIRDHGSEGHETVLFFPYYFGPKFSSQIHIVNLLRKDFGTRVKKVDELYEQFGVTMTTLNQELDRMTELMRRSTSTSVQEEFMKRIENEIKDMSDQVISITNTFQESSLRFTQKFNELTVTNDNDEKGKCREVKKEKISNVKCVECHEKQLFEKMFCCVMCSEPVKQLLDESEETEKWLNFEIESAVICAHCVIEGHQGGEHKIIKLPLIHRKYQSLIEFSNAQKKKMELEIQFSNLLNTLTLHKERIESYQSKMSEMSKLAINSRGEANHSVVFGDFKKCLDEAETAIQTLPIHLHKDFDKKQESCEQ